MSTIVFRALEGSNPLAFLAALGTLRLSSLLWPQQNLRLRWIAEQGWRPEVTGIPIENEDELCRVLTERAPWAPLEAFEPLGNNLTVSRKVFGPAVRNAVPEDASDRRACDFVVAFGSDVLDDKKKDRIRYTDLSFITGSGHQHFLGTARELAKGSGAVHLHEALFGPWLYRDKSLSFRWDPDDAKEYALRWRNPSVGGVASVWGANRLAFEALPLLPTMPTKRGVRTTGFIVRNRVLDFSYPIWTQSASVDTIRSLLALGELEQDTPDRLRLKHIGVEEVYRMQRVRIGQGANFKVSFRAARAV